ncbi:MAG: hypothetical protein ACREF1_14035, partial [Acetobacteraceae bacterium]
MATIIGWDVGGAHLKAARAQDGHVTGVVQLPCPLWLGLDRLRTALADATAQLGAADRHAATMTGELADVFASRAEGVAAITAALAAAFGADRLAIWAGANGFIPPSQVQAHVAAIASANWHA